VLLVKKIILAKINKKYIDRKIYIYEKKLQTNYIFGFNDNIKDFREI
jgi:hypothetical protein